MGTKFSEDIIPLSDLKVNPGRVVTHVNETHRPVLLTRRGRKDRGLTCKSIPELFYFL